jgi:hypothetical protein
MKKLLLSLILVILLSFVSCDTVTHYTMKVSVDRNPTLIIENRTGHPVVVTAPVPSNINTGARALIQPDETKGTINVTYRIGQVQFTEQATMDNADVTVILTKRPPTVTVVNKTGLSVNLTVPVSLRIDNAGKYDFLAPLNQLINITYIVGQMQITEQVTMKNEDVTVNLTKRPPYVTIANNTGSTVNVVFIRTPGTSWTGPNVLNLQLNPDGTLAQAQAGVQSNELRGSITNRDSFRFWTGNVDLKGNTFDIRIDDVQGNSYVKSNIQIVNDMTLNFSQSDKR